MPHLSVKRLLLTEFPAIGAMLVVLAVVGAGMVGYWNANARIIFDEGRGQNAYCNAPDNEVFSKYDPGADGKNDRQDEQRKKYELCQQWRSANAAENAVYYARSQAWSAGVSFLVLMFATASGVVAAYWAIRGVYVGRDQTRAYLSSKIARYAVRPENIQILLIITNSGNSPARNVKISGFFGRRTEIGKDMNYVFADVDVSNIAGRAEECGLIIIGSDKPQYALLTAEQATLEMDCTISWTDTFSKRHAEHFIHGYDAGLDVPVFGSKPTFKRELIGYQDTSKNA